MVLCKHYLYSTFGLCQNLTLQSFQLCLLVFFFIEPTFLNEMPIFFSGGLSNHLKFREKEKNFETLLVKKFWNFTMC